MHTALSEILPRGTPASGAEPAREMLVREIDAQAPAALRRRAAYLGIDFRQIGLAALALLDARLTGNERVLIADPVSPASAQEFTVPPDAEVDEWLRSAGGSNAQGGSAEQASVIGTWVEHDAAAATRSSIAWCIDPAQDTQLRAEFDAACLDRAAVELLTQALGSILRGLAREQRLQQVSAVDTEMRSRLQAWNGPAVMRDPNDTVHGLFARCAQVHPQRCAVVCGAALLSYHELNVRADRIAAALRARGIGADDLIAVLLERSVDAVVALLGILKAGAAYLPLDTAQPAERLAKVLTDAHAALVIGCRGASVGEPPTPFAAVEDLQEADAAFDAPQLSADARAYVMYTSGSTGEPKGVEIEHRAIIRLVRGVDYVQFGAEPRVLHAAPLGFDASTFEIWGALLNGGTVVIHDEAVPTGNALATTIREQRVQIAWLTATLFNTLVDEDPGYLSGLEQLLIGGEALSVPHVRKAFAALPDLTIINGYGPTECTTFTACHRIPRDLPADALSIPIGRPIANTVARVVNARGELVPIGATGELWIGGAGVARGYLDRPDLTAEKFIADPFGAPGDRLYRSGDLVRWLPEGVLEFVGRADGQIKLRGHRIEIGEIETVLRGHPRIRSAAVLLREDWPGRKRLVAYYVEESPLSSVTLRAWLARRLPDYMLPSAYMRLEALPLTANGKLDRRALPAPDGRRPELSVAYAAPQGAVESRLCQLFAETIGLDQAGRHDNFFELGGDSLLATRVLASLQREGHALSIAQFFGAPTAAGLAALLENRGQRALDSSRIGGGRDAQRHEPIAIVAMAGRFPGAADVETFWRKLCEGEETIRFFKPDELDPAIPVEQRGDADYVPARGVIDGVEFFDAAFFGITPREAELTDPQQRIFLELCWECIERAGHVPDAHDAPVGVFAGMYNASYFRHHVQAHPELIAKLGEFQVMLGNEKDYIATRVAHKLNLTGPAVSVHTACSTSLVAICQAVEALRAGQCRMALAGGASITCPPRSGYLYQEGAMLSPDGHTRTFAADAQGTVFSDGAAVVALKRLRDAQADGDPVIAVIRGGAVNNDGAHKASFTAPSSAGQAAVIAMALDDAQVDARSIGYVEAHGTATPLGDPIEIEGLTTAFRRDTRDEQYCAIGSVKSNVGHLVIAAGAAGVIKTALALQTRKLPPTLHAETTNPAIDFAHAPFVVNTQLREWQTDNGPRRAGVSSFGVGGTNAHVILEEAPQCEPSDPADGPQLLLLSARTPAALATAQKNLAQHLTDHPDSHLADVAWTLAAGRKALAQRAFVVAETIEEAAAKLDKGVAAVEALDREVLFMFPGQGAQYAGMGRALHAHEPAFREALDSCAEILAGELGLDLRQRLFAEDAEALRETRLTQPATFAIEYALAQLWLARGIRPAGLIGHSVGEFVAAVLAGVMQLDDALRLVARRGRLMQAQPAGAMLSVRLDAERLVNRLPPSLTLAAENAPNACVVSGEIADIETLRIALDADGIPCRLLRTSHAFHSPMMDAVVEPFRAEVERVNLAAPKLPIASTSSGEMLSEAEATSPEYWARHLRGTVRFARALTTLLEAHPAAILLEVGPRTTLTTLSRQIPAGRSRVAVASLADNVRDERSASLGAAGKLWCAGAPLDIAGLDGRKRKQRVRLPTYPFERVRHWVEALPSGTARASMQAAIPASSPIQPVMPAPNMPIGPAASAPAGDRRERLLAQIRTLVEEVSGVEVGPAEAAATFVELGLDSLALTQLALQLSKAFGAKVTFRQLMEDLSSPEKLAMHVDGQLPPESQPSAAATSLPAASMPIAGVSPQGDLLQQVIAQQMQIMQQQLAMLSGASAGVAPMGSVPAVPSIAAAAASAESTKVPARVESDEETALEHKHYDVKKAFGAIARIHSGNIELSERQRVRLAAFIDRYVAKTRKSKEYTERHRAKLADPRVVNGFRPLLKEIVYQIVVERSKGSRVWDLDGNEYVDALNGFGMNLFGWQPDFVLDAVRRQLDAGYEIGPQHPLAGEVAELICEMTGFDRAAFCNTGSEAVMGTVRVARTITGRETLVIFSGSYHGIFDEVIMRGTKKLKSVPAAPGILRNAAQKVLVLDYGTPESLEIIRQRAGEIAAVLVEPVQSRRPDFQPREFLAEVRNITREAGALLIFDEVVTGFRSHPRGAQHVLGVDADLASYGKVIGGGMPIGVIAGKRQYMDALDGGQWRFGDDSIPTVGVTYFAGTFVRHPLALAAAKASLEHLKAAGPALQEDLNARTAALVAELNRHCVEVGAPIKLTHFASVWRIAFEEEHPLQDLLFAMMRSRGVHILDHFPCFFTTAHSDADVALIAKAFRESVAELQESEFLPRRTRNTAALDLSRPPVAGARLGKDPQGRPAWYVPDPDQPGKYRKVEA